MKLKLMLNYNLNHLIKMKKNKLFSLVFAISACFLPFNANAQGQYPNVTGEIFMESRAGFMNDENSSSTYSDSVVANIEPRFSINLNNNWSVKSQWKLSSIKKRSRSDFAIGNVYVSDNFPDSVDDYGLVIEEIKGDYRNDDLNFFFGKFNPTFGSAWDKRKRIGLFVTDYAEDYELREKLGAGVAALFDGDGVVTLNLFFNDNTPLSDSAFNRRGKNNSATKIAGNRKALSSYSVTVDGNNFLGVENLKYNFGFRNLQIDNKVGGFADERGAVAGLEYSHEINYKTNLVPFFEISKINNFFGVKNQDILYITSALTLKHGNWNLGLSNVSREIDGGSTQDHTDNQFQIFTGYQFKNGVAVDVVYLDVKENSAEATGFGVGVSYLYEF